MDIPKNLQGEELFKFLKTNKEDIVYAKKTAIKYADSFGGSAVHLKSITPSLNKSASEEDTLSIKRRLIINTTNVVDSHKDVHVDGIWNKSLKENKNIKFLQEHQMSFKSIIADKEDLSVGVNKVSWKSLGFDLEGKTEALTFDATIKQSRNSQMFKEYKDGNIDQHSVGMHYVSMKLAINSEEEDYAEEKAVWDKYYEIIANKAELEKSPYFWAITEAKVIEGSAVVLGSNGFTPTQEVKEIEVQEEKESPLVKWLKK